MSKKRLTAVFLCLLAVSFAVIAICGNRFTGSYSITNRDPDPDSVYAEDWYVTAEEQGIVEISDVKPEGNSLKYNLRALKRGNTFLTIGNQAEGTLSYVKVYVHRFRIITRDSYFGNCTGGIMIPLSILAIMVLLFTDRLYRLRNEIKDNLYSYRNIMNFGLLTFMSWCIVKQVMVILYFNGIDNSIASVLSSAEAFAHIVLPVAFILFVLISLSNLNLMRKEGVNWHNMLGFILGLCLCLVTVLPDQLYSFLMTHQMVDVFNEKGIATHVFSLFEHSVFYLVAYLESVLLGTVVFSIRAARRIPAFDKDYILILGSRIRKDGTLPPLLRGRADRAVEFAEMQKAASGKDIIFVPSGGKGDDESIAEADAIRNYLVSKGIPEKRILTENQSRSTWENIRNSMHIIRKDYGSRTNGTGSEPETAFSTTNYHVFRAGLIASVQGCRMEGIGSSTRSYFWINAFIREFIATIISERKRHLRVMVLLLLGVILMVAVNYLSVLL